MMATIAEATIEADGLADVMTWLYITLCSYRKING